MDKLTPEDIEAMKKAIADFEGAPQLEVSDAEQDRSFLEPIVQALELVIEELEKLREEHDKLNEVVMEEIIGGVTKLYNDNERRVGVANIRSKYSESFGPYEESWKSSAEDPNADLYERLYDIVEELRKGSDYSEELEKTHMDGVLGRMKGSLKPSISVEVEEAAPVVKVDPMDKIRSMKAMAVKAGAL